MVYVTLMACDIELREGERSITESGFIHLIE